MDSTDEDKKGKKKKQKIQNNEPEHSGSLGFMYKQRDKNKRQIKPPKCADFSDILDQESSDDDEDFVPDMSKDKDIPFGSKVETDPEEDDEDGNGSDNGSSSSSSSSGELDGHDDDSQDVKPEDMDHDDTKSGLMSLHVKTENSTKKENKVSLPLSTVDVHERVKDVRICCVCCGDKSHPQDEIIECDCCGITVHELCYGLFPNESDDDDDKDDTKSVHSDVSSASTEPWFCDYCRSGLESDPTCDLCPNGGGIFKETDTGRWVHVVCALFTTGVTFSDMFRIKGISLRNVGYDKWGARACSLCPDDRFCGTGICIACDAGLCRTYFHVTCAQAHGLLHEVHTHETDQTELVDPYYAHCKIHVPDPFVYKRKKRNYLTLKMRMKGKNRDMSDTASRTTRKLDIAQQKWTRRRNIWAPPISSTATTTKMGRAITTSATAVKKLLHKADLLGLSATQFVSLDMMEIRKKWNVPPALTVEYVAYFMDRITRMNDMKKRIQQLQGKDTRLRQQDYQETNKFNQLLPTFEAKRDRRALDQTRLMKLIQICGEDLTSLVPLVLMKSPYQASPSHVMLPKKLKELPAVKKTHKLKTLSRPAITMNPCARCKLTKEQHLQTLCDVCHLYFHIYCLDPPLSRVPKKNKYGGFQCSDCFDRDKARYQTHVIEGKAFTSESEGDQADGKINGKDDKLSRKRPRRQPVKYSTESPTPPATATSSLKKMSHSIVTSHPPPSLIPGPSIMNGTSTPNKTATGNVPRKRGRPPLTDEQKLENRKKREAEKSLLAQLSLVEADLTIENGATCSTVVKQEEDPLDDEDLEQVNEDLPTGSHSSPSNGKKSRKVIIEESCAKCSQVDNCKNLVQCDECGEYHHFMCLDPPLKKTPKVRGYKWFCPDCESESEIDDFSDPSSNVNKGPTVPSPSSNESQSNDGPSTLIQ